MEKKLMRVTYTPSEFMDTQTVGRAQVLIEKDLNNFAVKFIKHKVRSIIATLGNVRYYKEVQKNIMGTKSAEELLKIAVAGIVEVESAGHKIVHLEVKIKDLDFYDYKKLLE